LKNKLLIPLIVASVIAVVGTSSMTGLFLWKNNSEKTLQSNYDTLDSEYALLEDAFQALLNTSEDLEDELESMVAFVKAMPLLDKMSFYYSMCRYLYFDHSTNPTMAQSGVDLILHSSAQYNAFSELDTLLTDFDFWEYGDSMSDAGTAIMNIFCVSQDGFSPAWLDCWYGSNSESDIFQWVKDHIDYTLDTVCNYGRPYYFDLFLSALETLKYKRGDCEDFSILLAAMMENNGFDTYFGMVNDPDHGEWQPDGLHHAFTFVKINPANYPTSMLWSFDGSPYEWLIVDVTPGWTANIGDTPGWLQWYIDTAFSDWGSIFTFEHVDVPVSPYSLTTTISLETL